jgi:iron-sulfur cluster repair protein YtfE (RIC family)
MSRSDDQPGLRLRLAHEARRIAVQHGYLDALEAATLRALERCTPAEAREALHGFRGALDAHFALEEQLHFPALHGLHAELAPEIGALERDHAEFRAAAEALEARVGLEPRGDVTHDFRALAERLREHEGREERMLSAFLPHLGTPTDPPG